MNSPIIMMPGKKNAQTITGWPQCASGKKTASHVHYPQDRLKSAMSFPRPIGKNKRKKMYGTEKRNFILMPFFVGMAILYTERRN